MLRQRPHKSSIGVKFKFSNKYSLFFKLKSWDGLAAQTSLHHKKLIIFSQGNWSWGKVHLIWPWGEMKILKIEAWNFSRPPCKQFKFLGAPPPSPVGFKVYKFSELPLISSEPPFWVSKNFWSPPQYLPPPLNELSLIYSKIYTSMILVRYESLVSWESRQWVVTYFKQVLYSHSKLSGMIFIDCRQELSTRQLLWKMNT